MQTIHAIFSNELNIFLKQIKIIRSPFKSRGLIMKEDDEKKDLLMSPATTSTNSAQIFVEQQKFHARQGHGYAAERANHIQDVLDGKKAKIVGGDNKKNGPDRNVNGRNIQTKFCKTSADTLRAIINPDGSLRYMDGSNPMPVEVPKDQYNDIVSKLEQKISNGEIKDIKDPNAAKRIIKKSPTTYAQSRNIAQSSTIDGLVFDFKQASVEITDAKYDIGVGALIVFAHGMWNGEDFGDALKDSCSAAIKSGTVVGVRSVVLSELSRTPIDDTVKNIVGSKTSLGKNAVARAEVISSVVTLAILSVPDFIRFFSGQMSFSQLCKNVTVTASGIAGGAAGASAGAALGSLVPGVGTVLGGIAGGIVGSLIGSSAASSILEDPLIMEAKQAERILHETLGILSQDFMLTQDDAELMMIEFKRVDRSNYLLDIYSADDSEIQANVCKTFVPIMQAILASHERIEPPSIKEYNDFLENGKVKKNFKYESYGFLKSEIQNSENAINANKKTLRAIDEQFYRTKSNQKTINIWLSVALVIFALLGVAYWYCSEHDLIKPFLIAFHLLAAAQMVNEAFEFSKHPEYPQGWKFVNKMLDRSQFIKMILGCLIVCWLPIGLVCQYLGTVSDELFWEVPTYISISIAAIVFLEMLVYVFRSIRLGLSLRRMKKKMKKLNKEIEKSNKNIENYKGKINKLLSKIHANTTKFETQYEPYELKDTRDFYADYFAEHGEDIVQNKSYSQFNEYENSLNTLARAMDRLGLSDMQFRM